MQSFIHSMIADKMADGHHHHRLLTTSQIYLVVVVIFTPYECWKKNSMNTFSLVFFKPTRSIIIIIIDLLLSPFSLSLVQKSLNFITNHSGSSSKKILDQYLRQTPCSKELVTNYFIHLSFIFIFSKFFFWFRI